MGKVATPKQTGHGGTDFEAKAIGYFLSCMVSKSAFTSNNEDVISRIDFQVRADGWLFDDALLTMVNGNSEYGIAVSIKSNRQFNNAGCSSELNRLLWEQYLGRDTTAFKTSTDFLCIVQTGISPEISTALNTLISLAKVQDAEDLHRRIYKPRFASQIVRTIYESMECPEDLGNTYKVSDAERVNLLKRFLCIEMDFEKDNSIFENRGIDMCRGLLVSKSIEEGRKVFNSLVSLAREKAKVSGYLTVETVLNYIKKDFDITGIPDHESDWEKLKAHTTQKLSLIPNKLGDKITINRDVSVSEIDLKLNEKPICLIEGISGAGKTALAKEIAELKKESCKVVWFDFVDLDSAIETELHLEHRLEELFQFVPSSVGYLFIDGAEKAFHERQQQKLALLINSALSSNRWKIIITCPSESVNSLIHTLHNRNVNTQLADAYQMPVITTDLTMRIATEFPLLMGFLMNESVQKILNNLKLLDKILNHIAKVGELEKDDLGESEVIDFVWREEIENSNSGIQKSSFLKTLAEKQADQLLTRVSISDFDPGSLSAADELKKEAFIQIHQQKIVFSHDLYADWALYKLVESQSDKLVSFLGGKHLSSPLWVRAIRLYGISLVEKDNSGRSWLKTFELFNGTKAQQIIIQNLLLEAFFFAANSSEILNSQKELLFVNEGKLFKKLLIQFLNSATIANPNILQIAKQIKGLTETEASAYQRLPNPWYWPDMITFIHENLDEALKIDLNSVVKIATSWLETTPNNFIVRKESSDITLKAAELTFHRNAHRYIDSIDEEQVYKGLLSGYRENENAVTDLCLRISKRKKDINEKDNEIETADIPSGTIKKAPRIMDMLPYTKRQAKQWEDGPFERIDMSFQKVCLETNAILPVVALNPKLAKEILLAVLIDEPDDRYLGMHKNDDDFSMYDPPAWYPPFFLRGPFLQFLRMQPKEGIDFVMRIVNFATDRWLENDREINKEEQGIIINYKGEDKKYFGDAGVFGWVRNGVSIPHSLQSILMAFEKFLCEEIDKGNAIDGYVKQALSASHSLAIVGVLTTVGKFQPSLFLTELKDLLPVYTLYHWDLHLRNNEYLLWTNDLPISWKEQAEEWNGQKKNLLPLKDTLINVFLINEDLEKEFVSILPAWERDFEKLSAEGEFNIFFFQMIPQFKKENYTKKTEEGKWWYEFIEPAYVTDMLQEGRERSLANLKESQVSMKMEMMIDKNLPFDIAGAEYTWTIIQQWSKEITQELVENDYVLGSPLANALASLDVLMHHESVWREMHSEYFDWIKSFLNNLVDMRLKSSKEFERHGTDYDWNVKFASILPRIWVKDTENKLVRKLVAACIILFNERSIVSFLNQAIKHFSFDSPDLIQVQNLLIQYYSEKRSSDKNYHAQPDELLILQKKWIDLLVEGKVLNEQMEWPVEIDMHRVIILLRNMPEFKTSKDRLKNYLLFLIRQGLSRVEKKLHRDNDKDYPDEFDNLVLLRVAECIPYLTGDEKPENYWSEVLKFGYLAEKWVAVFCGYYFRIHLPEKDNYPAIIREFQKMIHFAAKFPTWETKKIINRLGDFRDSLVGFDQRTISVWDNNYSDFIDQTKPIYQYWFEKNHYNPHTIGCVLKFMVTESGRPLLFDTLLRVKEFFSMSLTQRHTPPPPRRVYVGHPELDDKLASSLSHLWQHNQDLIRGNEEMFSNFLELVQYLIAIENVVGVELQQRLRS